MENEIDFEWNISANIYGESFSPRKLLSMTSLPLEKCHEKGDVVFIKKFRKVYGNGSARIVLSINSLSERTDEFDELLDSLVNNYEAIKESGGTSIGIWVAIFRSLQGNWNASAEQIQKIAAFNGSLAVTYYTS